MWICNGCGERFTEKKVKRKCRECGSLVCKDCIVCSKCDEYLEDQYYEPPFVPSDEELELCRKSIQFD